MRWARLCVSVGVGRNVWFEIRLVASQLLDDLCVFRYCRCTEHIKCYLAERSDIRPLYWLTSILNHVYRQHVSLGVLFEAQFMLLFLSSCIKDSVCCQTKTSEYLKKKIPSTERHMENFQAKRPLDPVLSATSCIGSLSLRSSPHWAVWQPAGITLLVSTVVGGQELLWRGNTSPDLLAGLSGLLKGKGVPAGCITIMEHHPCKTNNKSFANPAVCNVLCDHYGEQH